MKFNFFTIATFVLFYFISNNAYSLEFKGNFYQGSFIVGKTEPGAKVKIDDKKVLVTEDGYFAFGLGRDRQNDVIIRILNNEKLNVVTKKVFKRKYKIQKIDDLF